MSLNCDYCPKTFTTATAYNYHITAELIKIRLYSYEAIPECRNCHILFTSFNALQVHLKSRACRESNIPKYQCVYCHKYFTSRHIMIKHMTTYPNTCITIMRKNKHTPQMCNSLFDYKQMQLFPDLSIDQLNTEFKCNIPFNSVDLSDLDLKLYEFNEHQLECLEEYSG